MRRVLFKSPRQIPKSAVIVDDYRPIHSRYYTAATPTPPTQDHYGFVRFCVCLSSPYLQLRLISIYAATILNEESAARRRG
jgi:hypothetical protein